MQVELGVLTYASSLTLTSTALGLTDYTSLRFSCPVESEGGRSGIDPNRVPDSGRRKKAEAHETVSSRAGFKASRRRIPMDPGGDHTS